MCIHLGCICRLLDVLAGRKDPDGLKGNILIDGNKVPHNFKCMVGYVVQVSGGKDFKHLSVCSWIKIVSKQHMQNGINVNRNTFRIK